jgi:hypothetical protein
MDADLEALRVQFETDPEGAMAELQQIVAAEDPRRQALTKDEYKMLQRWESDDFPAEQTHLTHKESQDLTGAWLKGQVTP